MDYLEKEMLAKKLINEEVSIYDLSLEEIEEMTEFLNKDTERKSAKVSKIKKEFVTSYLKNKTSN